MTDLLGIGASGLSAYRSAMGTVSDNVANAETPGYSRRTTTLVQSAAATGTETVLQRPGTDAGGVSASAVTRAWDAFKTSEARLASADAGKADARSRWLQTAESALDDGDTGVSTRLTAVFTAGDALAGNPGDTTARAQMISALGDAADALGASASALARASDGVASEAQASVASINGDLGTLAQVNSALHRAGPGTPAAAALADQRDGLIDSLSTSLGVDVTLDDRGAATLTLTGSSTPLLNERGASTVALSQAADGRLAASLTAVDGARAAIAPGGTLGGLSDAAGAIAGRRTQLNGIAVDFAATMNGWQAKGVDASGRPGAALLTIAGSAATLALTTTDGGAIAAASTDGTANGNLLTLGSLRDASGAESRFAALVAANSQAVASAKTEASATATRRDSANTARDAVSGVDLDKEAADLLRFQQAYDASAKIVQAARETLQTILQLF